MTRANQADRAQHRSRLEEPVPKPRPPGWVVGTMVFAAFTMAMTGLFHAAAGMVALFRNEIYVVGPRYVFSFDVTVWGVIHLVIGVVLLAAAFNLRAARTWARVVGIVGAGVSMLAAFLFVPYYPAWSLLIVALDVLVVWGLCRYDQDAAVR